MIFNINQLFSFAALLRNDSSTSSISGSSVASLSVDLEEDSFCTTPTPKQSPDIFTTARNLTL